jgi:hypothetical protein
MKMWGRRFRLLWLFVLIALAAGAYWGVQRYRYRFVRSDLDLLHLLPARDTTFIYANIARLRHAGYLAVLAGSRHIQEADYRRFVQETGFDYARDLDSLAASLEGDQIWFVMRGHFDWQRLRSYAENHHAARPIRIREIQPDVLALAISANTNAIDQIRPAANSELFASNAPVWAEPSKAALLNPSNLPLPVRIFAISLQSAQSVVLALEPSAETSVAFSLSLNAAFRNASEADTARDQLVHNTALLKAELAREHREPTPSDLEWLLISGSFALSNNHLLANWPVRRELMKALQ